MMKMSTKPIILITGGSPVKDNTNVVWSIQQAYSDAVYRAGGVPILALNGNTAKEYADMADGLLVSGGRDVTPERYHREKKFDSVITEPRRDALEWSLMEAFMSKKKPIFGICRGMQMLNVYFGGTLYQDIPSELGGDHANGVNHLVTLKENSILSGLFEKRMNINSYHHQAIDDVAPGFVVTAWSDAGGHEIAEALEHETLPVWGVQWHPERMTGEVTNPVQCVDSLPIFLCFVNQCKMCRLKSDRVEFSLDNPVRRE